MSEKKTVLTDTNIFIDNNLTVEKRTIKSCLHNFAKDQKKDGHDKVTIKKRELVVNGIFKPWDATNNYLREVSTSENVSPASEIECSEAQKHLLTQKTTGAANSVNFIL